IGDRAPRAHRRAQPRTGHGPHDAPGGRMNTLKITKYQLKNAARSKWVVLYALFFLAATDSLFRFGGTGERVVLSLMNVVLLVIPLTSIVLGAMFLFCSRAYTEPLLSHAIK